MKTINTISYEGVDYVCEPPIQVPDTWTDTVDFATAVIFGAFQTQDIVDKAPLMGTSLGRSIVSRQAEDFEKTLVNYKTEPEQLAELVQSRFFNNQISVTPVA